MKYEGSTAAECLRVYRNVNIKAERICWQVNKI